MNLFQRGSFELHSGTVSGWKIDCDALTDDDWETLALMIKERVPTFGMVAGVPRGGIKLALALRKYEEPGNLNRRLLIVDDVLTTGQSMEKYRHIHRSLESYGAVVFARGPLPNWVTALFVMPQP